jgi:hypothetical protein
MLEYNTRLHPANEDNTNARRQLALCLLNWRIEYYQLRASARLPLFEPPLTEEVSRGFRPVDLGTPGR